MEIYSLQNIERDLLSSNLIKNLKSDKLKQLYLDKHNFVLNLIIKNNIFFNGKLYYFTNINSITFKKTIGDRYYKKILDNLKSLGFIVINDTYSSSRFSKSYSIPKSTIKKHPIFKTKIQSTGLGLKIVAFFKQEFEEVNSDPIFNKILINTSRLKLLPEFSYYIPIPDIIDVLETSYRAVPIHEDISMQILRYSDYSAALLRFNETNSIESIYSNNLFFKPIRIDIGRIFHMVASIPRLIRRCLRTKNDELIYEIDMASAQPSILILEYLSSTKDYDICIKEKTESEMCLKILLEGNVYKHIQENSSYFKELSNKDLKMKILKTLNAKKNNSKANKELLKIFPFLMKWINDIKVNQGHKMISKIGMNTEANIFVKVFSMIEPEVFALIIHDCIITTTDNTTKIKELLINRLMELYPNVLSEKDDLSRLFKIGLVSLKDDELPSYQEYLFALQEFDNEIF
jgi:hypothetical protein